MEAAAPHRERRGSTELCSLWQRQGRSEWHGAVPTALGSPFHAHRPLVQPLSLTPSCPSPDSSMPFPRALSLSHRAELSAVPSLPVRNCSRHEASPQLLCSALSQHRELSCSSYLLSSGPFLVFVALLWMGQKQPRSYR